MIAELADGQRNFQAILRRRQWAGGESGVCAGRIFQPIKIEDQLASLVEAVARKAGVEEPAGSVGSGRTGGVAEDEEQLRYGGIFQHRLKPVLLSMKGKLRGARDRLRIAGADQRGQRGGLRRDVWRPVRGHAVGGVGWVPLQAVKAGQCGRFCIFDAEGKAVAAMNDVNIEPADGHSWIVLVMVWIGMQLARLRGLAVN